MDQLWFGDTGDGRYINPVLFADYSDPDVICADGRYYMTASSFNALPGLPILVSDDLVNWTLVHYALPHIGEESYRFAPQHARGVWAPAIRRHGGYFYIFYAMPDEGVYCVRAADPLGPWEPPVRLLSAKGLIDPCPFWEEDGSAWVVHAYARSRIGIKSFLGAFPMDAEGTRAIGPDRLIYNGLLTQPTIEGPKAYRRGGYVYIFAPAGGVENGWQTVLRGRSIQGPFEERVVMRQGRTAVNGPHQGAWIETPFGEHWFLHFQQRGVYGRVVHLQPMRWLADGWPVIGVPSGDPTCGEPCLAHEKPKSDRPSAPLSLQASDDFRGPELAPQWQFMGEWDASFYALDAKAGVLRLFCGAPPEGGPPTLWRASRMLTQKVVCPAFTATVKLDFSGLRAGEQAGLALIGGQYACLAVRKTRTQEGERAALCYVLSEGSGETRAETVREERALPDGATAVRLKMEFVPTGDGSATAVFSAAVNGAPFTPFSPPFIPTRDTWVGAKVGLFALPYAASEAAYGYGDFSDYRVSATITPPGVAKEGGEP